MTATPRYTLGANVRAARESARYSLRGLSRRSGVSAATISMVEQGATSPSIDTAEKIAAGLGTELRTLLSDSETAAAVIRRGPK